MARESTILIRALAAGDTSGEPRLIQLVYDELRSLAGRMLVENPRASLQATELIHEAWLRLVDVEDQPEKLDGLRHYRRIAARAMRFVLVDRARARLSAKRGGGGGADGVGVAVTLDDDLLAAAGENADATLAVNEGLEQLQSVDEDLAQLVELRFFGGLTMTEIADNLGISERSAHRRWRLARAWWLEQFGTDGGRSTDSDRPDAPPSSEP